MEIDYVGIVKIFNLKYRKVNIEQNIGNKTYRYSFCMPMLLPSNPFKSQQIIAEQVANSVEEAIVNSKSRKRPKAT